MISSFDAQAIKLRIVENVAICWNIPCIPYAERYGVGTISRKGPRERESSETACHATDTLSVDDTVRSLRRRRAPDIAWRLKNPRLANASGQCARYTRVSASPAEGTLTSAPPIIEGIREVGLRPTGATP